MAVLIQDKVFCVGDTEQQIEDLLLLRSNCELYVSASNRTRNNLG